ncbi:hypothetical protein [Kitasatospora sp. GP82]|nr:hypothetical protein [Kitasatospora sp. GP82]MDH6124024.1 hypothetical protein [Kitasatospora sp. GP82]
MNNKKTWTAAAAVATAVVGLVAASFGPAGAAQPGKGTIQITLRRK